MSKPSDPDPSSKPVAEIVSGYEQLFSPGKLPDLVSFVAAAPPLAPRDLAALVHVDQQRRYTSGALLPAETYFESFPALRSDAELALDIVYQEYALRRDAGEAYPNDKYLTRFPNLAERLAMQFQLDGALGDNRSSTSLPNPLATTERPALYAEGTILAGRYQLLEEIGEGGMGAVWLAQQTEPVRRRVAVKLIKPGMDSRQVLSRFEAERQALAVMDHPHIAKVLDGGATEQGRPFFVMEYVKGEPITDYCDRARLSVQQRLKLFVQVCQAVQHAHQKGIIHRDLKPSNILVCPFDGLPVPKVIDFGLAKAMNQELTEQPLYTAHGVMVGTPLYMSPEQAETNNLDIDTRSDVYSLGVILYELLTGGTPLEKQRIQQAAWQEMLRLIKEEEPPKPSTRLSDSGSLPTIAAQRNLEPAQLSRAVRGDLDWIVMKSLEKERSRRYETANGLARDIERYLHDDPVEARPPSAAYRFRKFARRNKGGLLTIGLVAAALVVGTIVSTWQAIRATRAEQVADAALSQEAELRQTAEDERNAANVARAAEVAQRRVAEKERAEAVRHQAEALANYQKAREAVDKYFTLVSESTLFDVPGLETLRKDLLEAALEFYKGASSERNNDPAALVDLAAGYLRLFTIYTALNRADDALVAARSALEIIDRLHREYGETDEHERKLGGFWKGERWTRVGMDAPRDSLGAFLVLSRFEKLWTRLVERFPAEPAFQADLGLMRFMMGIAMFSANRVDEGIALHRKAREISEMLVRDYPEVPQYRADLAMGSQAAAIYIIRAGRTDDVLPLTRQGLELAEGLVAEFPAVPAYRANLITGLTRLATLLAKTEPERAKQMLRRATELAEAALREYPGHLVPMQLWGSTSYVWLSFDPADRDDAEVERTLRQTFTTGEALLTARPTDNTMREGFGLHYGRLARQLTKQGLYPDLAEQMRQRSLELLVELTRDTPDNADNWSRLLNDSFDAASDVFARANGADADDTIRQSLDALEAMCKAKPTDLIARLRLAAFCHRLSERRLWQENNSAAAEAPSQRAFELSTELANENPTAVTFLEHVGWSRRALGDCSERTRRFDDATRHFELGAAAFGALAANKNISDRSGWYRDSEALLLMNLGRAQAAGGQKQAGLATLRRVADLYRAITNDFAGVSQYDQHQATALDLLADTLDGVGQAEEAVAIRKKNVANWQGLLKSKPADRQARQQLAWTLTHAIDSERSAPAVRLPLIERALTLHTALANEIPSDSGHLEQTGHLYRRLGWLVRSKGELDRATEQFQRAAAVFQKLATDKIPQRDGLYRAIQIDTLFSVAVTQGLGGHANEAVATAQQAVDASERLVREYPGVKGYREKLDCAVGELAERLIAADRPSDAVPACRRQIAFYDELSRIPLTTLESDAAGAHLTLCFAQIKCGELSEAQQTWEELTDLSSIPVPLLNRFAWKLAAPRDVDPVIGKMAVAAALAAVNATSEDGECLNTLGVAQYRTGQWEASIASLTQAEKLSPGKHVAFDGFFLAMAHWRLDHKDEARKWYELSVEWMKKNQRKDDELIRFRAEAEQLLGITQSEPASKDLPQADGAATPKS